MLGFSEFLTEKESKPEGATKGVEVHGIHYSNTGNLSALHGNRFGTGIKAQEAQRLSTTSDHRIKNRVYFYNKGQHEVLPRIHESGLGQHTYSSKLGNMYHPDHASDAQRAEISAHKAKYIQKGEHPSNAFESAVLDSGYHGYTNGQVSIALNHKDVPVKYEGLRHEILSKSRQAA